MSDTEVLTQRLGGNNAPQPKRSRDFCMTIWDEKSLKTLIESKPKYLVYAEEFCPTTNRKHYQCYVYYMAARFLTAVRKMLPKNDVRVSLGTAQQNRTYIIGPYSKDGKEKPFNPNNVEIGECPMQGKRNDIVDLVDAIKLGKRKMDLVDECPVPYAKYTRFATLVIGFDNEQKAHEMYEKGIFPECHIIWGEPGVGKTRHIYEKYNNRDVYCLALGEGSRGSVWWCGYTNQPVILVDEFEGQMAWGSFLKFTDRYPYQMQTKGGHTFRLATHIYFTSNSHPKDWYPANKYAALERRMTSITEMK